MSESSDEHYTINDQGWATCTKCGNQYKGAGEAKTRLLAEDHWRRKHSNLTGQSIMMENPLISKRTNYGAWV